MTSAAPSLRAPGWLSPADPRFAALLVALTVVFSVFILGPALRGIPFLYGQQPDLPELYLTSYTDTPDESGLLSVQGYASPGLSCQACGQPLPVSPDGRFSQSLPAASCDAWAAVTCGNRSVGFLTYPARAAQPVVLDSLQVAVDGQHLLLTTRGSGDTRGHAPFSITVDGKTTTVMHSARGAFSFTDRVWVEPGPHSVTVSVAGQAIDRRTVYVPRAYPWWAALAFVSAAATAVSLARDRALVALVFCASALVFLALAYQGGPAVTVALTLVVGLAAWAARNRAPGVSLPVRAWPGALALAGLAVLLSVGLQQAFGSFDGWGPYYYRHADLTLAHGSSQYLDSDSYLGRPATYPPAFFDAAAALAGLAGAASFQDVRPWLHAALVGLLSVSLFLLYSRERPFSRWLAAGLVLANGFFLTLVVVQTLHVFAYALAAFAALWWVHAQGAVRWAALVPLGVALAAHPTSPFFFLALAWSAQRFTLHLRWIAESLAAVLASAAVALVFYLPIFLQSGLPYAIQLSQWGYLVTYGVGGVLFEFNVLLVPILLAIGVAWSRPDLRLPAALALLLLAGQAFVSYRLNLLAVVLGAAVAAFSLDNACRQTQTAVALVAVLSVGLYLIPLTGTTDYCTWGLANSACLEPLAFLAGHASYQDALSVPTLWTHLATFTANKRLLADAYVEYAKDDQFTANDAVQRRGDASQARAYGVTLALTTRGGWPPRAQDGAVDGATAVWYDNGHARVWRLSD